jgi:hypothetical protein
MTRDLIILFVSSYVGSGVTPNSTLKDQAGGSGSKFDDLAFDFDFDFLQGLQSQDEFVGRS